MMMKKKKKRIKDVLTPLEGVFEQMEYDFKYATLSELDVLFFTTYGDSLIAPIVNHFLDNGILTSNARFDLSRLILTMYRQKWDKLLTVMELEYDPIHNFLDEKTESGLEDANRDFNENTSLEKSSTNQTTLSIDKTGTEKDSGNLHKTGTDSDSGSIQKTGYIDTTRSDNLTETYDNNRSLNTTDTTNGHLSGSNTSEMSIQAFNSSTYRPYDKNVDSSNSTDNTTLTKTGVISDNASKNNTGSVTTDENINTTDSTQNTKTLNLTDTSSNTKTLDLHDVHTTDDSDSSSESGANSAKTLTLTSYSRQYHRKGNIGNISTQSLIHQEIELWNWNFIQEVLKDVKSFLTLQIYQFDSSQLEESEEMNYGNETSLFYR